MAMSSISYIARKLRDLEPSESTRNYVSLPHSNLHFLGSLTPTEQTESGQSTVLLGRRILDLPGK